MDQHQGMIYESAVARLEEENARLRDLLAEVYRDIIIHPIDRYTEARIRAVLEPKKSF